MMKQMRIAILDNLEVVKMEIEDSEIPDMLDSGFYTAVLRQANAGVEYADVDFENWTVKWVTPQIRE